MRIILTRTFGATLKYLMPVTHSVFRYCHNVLVNVPFLCAFIVCGVSIPYSLTALTTYKPCSCAMASVSRPPSYYPPITCKQRNLIGFQYSGITPHEQRIPFGSTPTPCVSIVEHKPLLFQGNRRKLLAATLYL